MSKKEVLMNPIENVIEKLKGVKKSESGWTALCPTHKDRQNSLSLKEGDEGKVLIKCFAGCATENIVKALGLEMADLFPNKGNGKSSLYFVQTPATAQPIGCTLENYSHEKAIPVDFLKELGLKDSQFKGTPRIEIPYMNETGVTVSTRYRCAIEKGSDGIDKRFTWKTGSKVHLYGLWKLKEFKALKTIVLVEGESDCHTLWYHNISALGIPGASTWKNEWEKYLECFESIYVVIEPDKGGETSLNWISRSKLKAKIKLLELNPYKDPSEIHLSDQIDFIEFWENNVSGSQLWLERENIESNRLASEAWKQCQDLAESSSVLDLFTNELEKAGAVGVEREGKILFLAVVSRFLKRPISVAVKGPSSAGKSFLVEKVLEFFPKEAYYALSAMSDKALIYTDESLVHRILVIYEAVGMQSDMTSYLIRTLLSEGCIKFDGVNKTTSKGLGPLHLEKEGPTGLIVTTTQTSLHPENETRMFSLTLQDTQEQTKRILNCLADRTPTSIDLKKWHDFQKWINTQNNKVFIPFAKSLAELIPPVIVRLRRDFHQVLNLIESHALLHQATRKRNSEGKIIAELKDYEAVHGLIADIIQQQAGVGITPAMRETVEAVQKILEENGQEFIVTQTYLKKKLGLDKASISRRVRASLEAGYLINLEDKKGKPYRLKMGEPLPEALELLPSPEKLISCAVATESEVQK